MKNSLNLNNIKNFAVYYGCDNIEKLSAYDLVVVEPSGQSKKNIKYIKKNNTIVIAYVSILEISDNSLEFKYLKEEDLLKINDEKIINESYDNYLIDLRSKHWNSMLIQKIGNLLLNENYDGIFLDTVGDIEFDIIPNQIKDSLITALMNLLSEVRKLFNDCIIIQNNGITKLVKYTGTLIDGVMWENPSINSFDFLRTKSNFVEFFKILTYRYGIRGFILIDDEKILKSSRAHNMINSICIESEFLLYISRKDYLDI